MAVTMNNGNHKMLGFLPLLAMVVGAIFPNLAYLFAIPKILSRYLPVLGFSWRDATFTRMVGRDSPGILIVVHHRGLFPTG